MKNRVIFIGLTLSAFALGGLGCSSDDDPAATPGTSASEGKVAVTVTGEDGAKSGFPTTGDEPASFVDGYTVKFSKYIVAMTKTRFADTAGNVGGEHADAYVMDLSKGDVSLPELTGLSAKRWDDVGFTISPPSAAAKVVGGATDADRDALVQKGYSYWMEGTAEKGGKTINFAFGFPLAIAHSKCTNGADEKAGLVVEPNATAAAEFTFHVEHVFWDKLGSEEANMRFDALAGAAGMDNTLDDADLKAAKLSALVGPDGMPLKDDMGAAVVYDPGSTTLTDQTLYAFMQVSVSTQAHLNGEGLCTLGAAKLALTPKVNIRA